MSPRTVHFNYTGWPYQLYLRSLAERGMQEPARASRCEVLAGALWMLRTMLWKHTLGARVGQPDDLCGHLTVLEILGILVSFFGGGGLAIVALVYGVAWSVETVRVYAPMGIGAAVFMLLSPWLFLAICVTVILGIGFALYKIRFFHGIAAAFRFARETTHFVHEAIHDRVEGTFFCPLVVVTNRSQTQQAE